jgi:hypothetical protein
MADYCVTVAKLSKLMPAIDPPARLSFEEMGARCEEMTRVALDSFRSRSLEGVESLVDLDELVDRANRRVVQHCSSSGPIRPCASTGCAWSSFPVLSSGSATTRSTSASGPPTS